MRRKTLIISSLMLWNAANEQMPSTAHFYIGSSAVYGDTTLNHPQQSVASIRLRYRFNAD